MLDSWLSCNAIRTLAAIARFQPTRTRSPGANVGATQAKDFLRQADGYGQPSGDHVSSRTDPDDTERLTVATDQKVIREACDNFLHYELNANRALARET